MAAAALGVYLAFVAVSIAHGFSASSFAFVGRDMHQPTSTLARYAPPGSTRGYDGQYALFIALDPLHARSVIDAPAYRYSHILYPALARAAALGSPARVPAAMLAVNLLAVAIGVFAIARLLERRRRSPWLALLVAFYPGTFLAVARDLNEPVAIAVTALGLLLLDWASPRRIAATGGRTEAQLRASLLALFAERGQRAVRIGAMSARQARTLLSEQRGTVDAFMARPYRTTDQQRDYAALVCHLPAPH